MAQRLKRLPGIQKTWVQSLGREDPLEKEMAIHSSTPCFGVSHGARSLVGYSPWGRKESDITERLSLSLFSFAKQHDVFMIAHLRMKSQRELNLYGLA